MLLEHIGIVNRDKKQAELFYEEFLGLEKIREFTVPKELSYQLFLIPEDIKVIVFEKDDVKIEVFILKEFTPVNISHSCLYLKNFSKILKRAEKYGVEIIKGKTKEKTIYFIKDFSGNLFEIKPLEG